MPNCVTTALSLNQTYRLVDPNVGSGLTGELQSSAKPFYALVRPTACSRPMPRRKDAGSASSTSVAGSSLCKRAACHRKCRSVTARRLLRYQDGASLSGETNAQLEAFGGSPNSTSFYEFRVTDSQGRTVAAGRTVFTTAGCGTLDECH